MPFLERRGLEGLLGELRRRGYELIGPTVRDGTVALGVIDGAEDLPAGIGLEEGPGVSRLVRRDDRRMFAFAHGPDSGKRFLFPPRETVATARREGPSLSIVPSEPDRTLRAFIGLRACDLHAIAVQDRVFTAGPAPDPLYGSRRTRSFFVGVNCTEPGATCFCASMGTGPRCTIGADLVLTELNSGFVVEAATPLGREVLAAVETRDATAAELAEAEQAVAGAEARMGRRLDTSDLPELLYRNREHPRWADVAERCLACGNCTAVCPTCFCHDILDAADLAGATATRTREWATCFAEEFSHTAGHDVRSGRAARYRQWLTHKFAAWIDQYGASGCVGCGRCITWCPVGIDVTEEVEAIRSSDGAVAAAAGVGT